MKKSISMILFMVIILCMGISALAETSPCIYILDDLYFGMHRDMSVSQRMNIWEIEKAAKQSGRIKMIFMNEGELRELKNGEVHTFENEPSSTLYLDKDLFDRFSDKKYYEDQICAHTGKCGNIHDIMYKQNSYEYEMHGNTSAKEAWLFGDNNVYIADIDVSADNVQINNLRTYYEWYDAREYKPEGKCMVNGVIVSEGIYANSMESKVPLRAVTEAIGGIVEWSNEDCSASIYYEDKTYTLNYFKGEPEYMGGMSLEINGIPYALGRQSGVGNYYMENGTTYISYLTAKKLFGYMGCNLAYDGGTKTVEVISHGI